MRQVSLDVSTDSLADAPATPSNPSDDKQQQPTISIETSTSPTRLNCVYFNARSLAKHGACDSLTAYTLLNDVDIIFISETWLTDIVKDRELSLNDRYSVFRKDRESRGGGVIILVKKSLSCSVVDCLSAVEAVSVDVLLGYNTIRFVCCYITNADGGVKRDQIVDVDKLFEALVDDRPIIICGDFNLPHIQWNTATISSSLSVDSLFVNSCLNNGLTQLVTENTRTPNGSEHGSVLDLLLTTDPAIIGDLHVTSPPIKTDHMALSFQVLIERQCQDVPGGGFDFYRGNYEQISQNLSLVSWSRFFSDCHNVDAMYNKYIGYMHFLIESFVPKRTNIRSHHKLREYIERLKSLIETDSCPNLHSKLKRATLRLRILDESALSFRNTKEFFRYANKRIKGKQCIGAIKLNGELITNDEAKADIFKNFFASVFVSHQVSSSPSIHPPPNTLLSPPICVDDKQIVNKIKELKSKCSITPDSIPPLFYKMLAIDLAQPLRLIFQRSYEEGVVPQPFRLSVVTPVHKKNSLSDVDNYRPVAQEVVACLIFEKILVDHINRFLSLNNLLDHNQHGFTRGKSTSTQLLETVHDWALYKNRGERVDCVYFDYSKAFDRVHHHTLVKKLSVLGIDNRTVSWIRSYLSDRKFCVRVNNSYSDFIHCPSGVPQGSCIGPLLFNLFILDIGTVLPQGVTYKLYADDLKLYCPTDTLEGKQTLQLAIDAVSRWCAENDMMISIPKCAILSSKKQCFAYKLDNQDIPYTLSIRDLGVMVTPSLDFDLHITQTIKSANAVMNTVFRCFVVKKPEFYLHLFSSLVLPKFLYCCEVWRPFLNKHLEAIERVQSRFIKRVSKRCNIPRANIELKSISDMFDQADTRMYNRLRKLDMLDKFFVVKPNSLRSGMTINALQVASNDRINNFFPWRISRKLHALNKM